MTVKLSTMSVIDKELDGNKEAIPFTPLRTPFMVFGENNADTVYYDVDTNRVTIYLSGYHTAAVDAGEEFAYILHPVSPEMDSRIDYVETDYHVPDRLISFTPLPGTNEYQFVNTIRINIGETEIPDYMTIPYIGVTFSFDA